MIVVLDHFEVTMPDGKTREAPADCPQCGATMTSDSLILCRDGALVCSYKCAERRNK